MTGIPAGAVLLSGLTAATPLLLASAGETLRERAGILDIGVEGEMLAGACAAFALANFAGSASAGLAAAGAAGMLFAALFAASTIRFGAHQIVAGTAVNLIALGATGFLARFGMLPEPGPAAVLLPRILGPLTALDLAAIAAAPAITLLLFRTSAGLRLRVCGESVADAAALRISVPRFRAACSLAGGALAGLGGAALTLELSDRFVEGMSAGRGFIALALVAFGRWTPVGAAAAAIFFGVLQAVQYQLQARGVLDLPAQALLLLPYVLSLAALAGWAGRSRAPANLGR
jgi:ABC-type uncharacterized transport system permease subunit